MIPCQATIFPKFYAKIAADLSPAATVSFKLNLSEPYIRSFKRVAFVAVGNQLPNVFEIEYSGEMSFLIVITSHKAVPEHTARYHRSAVRSNVVIVVMVSEFSVAVINFHIAVSRIRTYYVRAILFCAGYKILLARVTVSYTHLTLPTTLRV